jgi:hypothetical protein
MTILGPLVRTGSHVHYCLCTTSGAERRSHDECEDSLLNFKDLFSEEGCGEPLSFKPP